MSFPVAKASHDVLREDTRRGIKETNDKSIGEAIGAGEFISNTRAGLFLKVFSQCRPPNPPPP